MNQLSPSEAYRHSARPVRKNRLAKRARQLTALFLAAGILVLGLTLSQSTGVVEGTEASWNDSGHAQSQVSAGTLNPVESLRCERQLFQAARILWNAPNSDNVTGYRLSVHPVNNPDSVIHTETLDANQRSFSAWGRVSFPSGSGNYTVRIMTVGHGEWTSEVRSTTIHRRLVLEPRTVCA